MSATEHNPDLIRRQEVLFLFDLDGTLTLPRQKINQDVCCFLKKLRQYVTVGIVSGSDMAKITEQLQLENVKEATTLVDYIFAENGTLALYQGLAIGETANITAYLGEDKLQAMINFILRYIADLKLPVKRGTFIELRTGMINISPIGRNCTAAERRAFFQYDQQHKIRETFVQNLQQRFGGFGVHFCIGGEISIDCAPIGWDKRYCLRHLSSFKRIHFFGDKTNEGGNDHTLYKDPKTIGHSVTSPDDTVKQVGVLLSALLGEQVARG